MAQPLHIDSVRTALLDTLADLRNKKQPMDIERAKAVAQVAGVLVDTVKVENDYLKITGCQDSTFLASNAPPAIAKEQGAHNPFGKTVHRLQG